MGCIGTDTRENIDFEELKKQREKEQERMKKELDEQRKIEEQKIEEMKKNEEDNLHKEIKIKKEEEMNKLYKEIEELKKKELEKLQKEIEEKRKKEEDKLNNEIKDKKEQEEKNQKEEVKINQTDKKEEIDDEDVNEYEKLKNEEIAQIIPSEVKTPSKDCVFLGVLGSFKTDKQKALDRLNEIREEACKEGVKDPHTGKKFTESDYRPLKWSTDLERVARIRGVEGALTMAHERLNGKSIWGVVYNSVRSLAENLAWNWESANSIDMINQWYEEKHDWVTGGKGVTGHYESIISSRFYFVGLGWFVTKSAKYPSTLAGSFSDSKKIEKQDFLDEQINILQTIEVLKKSVKSYYLEGKNEMETGKTQILIPKVNINVAKSLYPINRYTTLTYESDNNKIAKVNKYGKVSALLGGSVTIKCKNEDQTVYSTLKIKVNCTHEKGIINKVEPTCTKAGKKILKCNICNNEIEEQLKIIPHDYNFTMNQETLKTTGICKSCQKTITFKAPSKMKLFWRNKQTADSEYYSNLIPDNNPVGSIICVWNTEIDGDDGYQDLVYEISDTSLLEYSSSKGRYTDLKVLNEGEVEVTIYARYNPNLKFTYNIVLG